MRKIKEADLEKFDMPLPKERIKKKGTKPSKLPRHDKANKPKRGNNYKLLYPAF